MFGFGVRQEFGGFGILGLICLGSDFGFCILQFGFTFGCIGWIWYFGVSHLGVFVVCGLLVLVSIGVWV